MALSRQDLVPYGVNIGGWFCLEDWFYSAETGPSAGHCVKTPEPGYDAEKCRVKTEDYVADVQKIFKLSPEEARALPRPRFGCESDLINLLLEAGLSHDRIVKLFWQHRRTYVMPVDFARIRAMGIRRVRLPLTWCISYDTPYTIKGKSWQGKDTSTNVLPGSGIVEDPFTNDPAFDPKGINAPSDKWLSIPIAAVEAVLETAASYGVEVLIDLHAFPGGSSAGTFNGIWPWNPRFWSAHREENFRTIICRMLDWMESLRSSNPRAFRGLHGFTPMNEPAHLRGLHDAWGCSTYDLRGAKGWSADASASDVLGVLAISVGEFRRRPGLAANGKRLVMNIIETSWPQCFGAADKNSFGASLKEGMEGVYEDIGSWWRGLTTPSERQQWAVLDIHNYISWNPAVGGFVDIKDHGEFSGRINDLSLPFFRSLRDRLGLPKPELLATAEYSGSTDQDTFNSITSGVGRKPTAFPGFKWWMARDAFLAAQHLAAREASIDMWFWTYHIRKNVNYQGEWSLQHILSPWPRLTTILSCPFQISNCRALGGEALRCIYHGAYMGLLMLFATVQAPLSSLWLQRCGLRFHFRNSGGLH
mmetsp:Transcript_73362/g.159088  ORF Transcript_73362/g.159088 Transcript_73362/m.159088 type:complete len:589 (+) Transcript_73362:34-1800(+)